MKDSDLPGGTLSALAAARKLARGRPRTYVLAAAVAGALALGGLPFATLSGPPPAVAGSAAAPASFADLAAKVTPAVVTISSTHKLAVSDQGALPDLPFRFPPGSPFDEFFKQFQQDRQGGRHGPVPEGMALGSGFIIDPAGYIVTNNHVIDGASQIRVTLSNGDEYPARLVGRDARTDLALLKIDAPAPLPAVSFGNSDSVRVGDWVMAVGNPFGLGGTVTSGIVSARGRDIHAGPFDDFLQIDASINQGNSGGPTFALDGSVIGVNTAIASPNGGSVGIGFAIPSNLAKTVVAQLREHGSVERGWLGVAIQPVTPELAAALGLEKPEGALVARVEPNSPAARARLQPGDVILGFDGKQIGDVRDLTRLVAAMPAGRTVPISVWRDRAKVDMKVEIARLENQDQVAQDEGQGQAAPGGAEQDSALLGLTLAPMTPDLKSELGVDASVNGVVVVGVDANGPAAAQGIRQGDVIEKAAQEAVSSPAQVEALAKAARDAKSPLLLLINRGGQPLFVAVNLASA